MKEPWKSRNFSVIFYPQVVLSRDQNRRKVRKKSTSETEIVSPTKEFKVPQSFLHVVPFRLPDGTPLLRWRPITCNIKTEQKAFIFSPKTCHFHLSHGNHDREWTNQTWRGQLNLGGHFHRDFCHLRSQESKRWAFKGRWNQVNHYIWIPT